MLSTVLPPSCTLHRRGYHSWDNKPLFFQFFRLLSLLPLALHLGPLAPHSKSWQEKHDACASTGHQSSSTCRSIRTVFSKYIRNRISLEKCKISQNFFIGHLKQPLPPWFLFHSNLLTVVFRNNEYID